MSFPSRGSRIAAAVLTLAASLVSPLPSRGGEIADKMLRGLSAPFKARHRTPPATGIDCAVEQLANEIDWLEHYIDRYGSVVAKEPDVWGQGRLTRYRREYEDCLAKELGKFQELNNASLARSDQSFLGLALAINAAAGGGSPAESEKKSGSESTSQQVLNLISTGTGAQGSIPLDRSDVFVPLTGSGGGLQNLYDLSGTNSAKIALEPTIHLDHLSRYLHHLHELRRINEGDDTADSPGYALNLVRIPVSILPGKETQAGHGAEITVTADLQLGDDLLPTTFRNLVVNDLVDVVAPSLTFAVNDPEMRSRARSLAAQMLEAAQLQKQEQASAALEQEKFDDLLNTAVAGNKSQTTRDETARKLRSLPVEAEQTELSSSQRSPQRILVIPNKKDEDIDKLGVPREQIDGWTNQRNITRRLYADRQSLESETSILSTRMGASLRRASPLAAPSVKVRRARLPIPLSQLPDVAGDLQMAHVIEQTYTALQGDPYNQPHISYMAVRGFLNEEFQAAYDFLALPEQQRFWAELPGWGLPELIRGRQTNRLEERRCAFFMALGLDAPAPGAEACGSGGDGIPCLDPQMACCNKGCCRPICRTLTAIFAWSILCDAALLNQRLIEDMQEAASAKGRVSPAAGGMAGPFFGSNPGPEARRAFNDYVRLRWPIRVFALDPVAQEQNVEDAFSMRRETQIAMALAASRGRAGTQAMMRYARRLETDLATIALNKTAVGFSHGSDTFGWRFYPRVQTPPTRNNLATFADTLVGNNSTTRDLQHRRLEPGLRECTALVVMPSFVPYATFDVRTNWFSLTHPRKTDLSMRQTLELSRSVKAMQQSAAICGRHAHAYRDGEIARLMRRVEQLDRELPLQSLVAQIPFENTAGGFELFNTGVTDLAPEVLGWYGGTGIDPKRPTSIFIVGKGFSVHDTQVIAGGEPVAAELISREVMKITIPPNVRCIRRPTEACGESSAATPTEAARRGRPPRPIAGAVRPTAIRQVGNTEREPEPIALPLPQPQIRQVATPGQNRTADSPESAPIDATAAPAESPSPIPDCDARCGKAETPCDAAPRTEPEHYVDVHLATPYGVSGHLLIPVVRQPACASASNPDPSACSLVIAPPAGIELTASPTKAGTWRVNEYFAAVPESISIRVPKWFVPPPKAEINWTIREPGPPGEPGTVVGKLSTAAPHFEACTPAYVFDGAELRNLVGDTSRPATDKTLRGAIKPYLDHIGSQPSASFDRQLFVTAALVAGGQSIPIEGTLAINVKKSTQGSDE